MELSKSSLSCEIPRRVLIWDFQYDGYLSVWSRFGLLDYFWAPSSTWVAFLMVDGCELSLGSSLYSEVFRPSFLPGGPTHEFSSRRSYSRVLFTEVLWTSSLLGGLTHELSSRRSYVRVLFSEISRMSSLLGLPLPCG